MDEASPARRRFRLVAIALPIVLLLLLEAGLRLGGFERPLDPPPYRFVNPEARAAAGEGPIEYDAELFWRLRAGAAGPGGAHTIAASGFRTEFESAKAAGARRVICLGDSSAFGLHVGETEAWPAVLARRLRLTSETPTEVLNLGVPGYTSHQGRRLLAMRGAEFEPDDVVVAFGALNDWVPARGRTDREQRDPPVWRTLRIVQLAASAVGRAAATDRGAPPELRTLRTVDHTGPRRVPPTEFEENLRALHAETRRLGARLTLVAQPLPAATVRRNPIAVEYAAIVRRVGGDLGVPVADGWRAFAESGDDEAELFHDFCHPSPLGHTVLAAAVQRALEDVR